MSDGHLGSPISEALLWDHDTLTLDRFLLARLDEDYEATSGTPSPWREGKRDAGEVLDRHGYVTAIAAYYGGTYGRVLRFEPTRIIRDIEAKRKAVHLHSLRRTVVCIEAGAPPLDTYAHRCRSCRGSERVFPCKTLRALAEPYSDHLDYEAALNVPPSSWELRA